MKKIVSLLALLLIINTSKSQVAVFRSTAFIDSVSQPGTKKYGFKFNFDGINVPIIFKLIDWQNTLSWFNLNKMLLKLSAKISLEYDISLCNDWLYISYNWNIDESAKSLVVFIKLNIDSEEEAGRRKIGKVICYIL